VNIINGDPGSGGAFVQVAFPDGPHSRPCRQVAAAAVDQPVPANMLTSTPPDPAYVGDTYEVTAESTDWNELTIRTDTPDICSLPGAYNDSPVTATFRAAGTCKLIAGCKYPWDCAGDGTYDDFQTFEVVEPLVTLPVPLPPGTNPPIPPAFSGRP
jgi:hypothetical protein